jgi:hypothetical protein
MDIDRRQPGLDRIAGSDLRLDQISHGTYFGEERGLRAIMDISARAISLDGVIGRPTCG